MAFDQRLLTINGWGVTLNLASLGFGFQQRHCGLFLVAAVTGPAFWLLEGSWNPPNQVLPKGTGHRGRRLRVVRVEPPSGVASSPLINWGFETAATRVAGGADKGDPRRPEPYPRRREGRYKAPWLWPHVTFPHVIAVIVGTVLFVLVSLVCSVLFSGPVDAGRRMPDAVPVTGARLIVSRLRPYPQPHPTRIAA